MKELHISNLGLVIESDPHGFVSSLASKSAQKVSIRLDSKRQTEKQVVEILKEFNKTGAENLNPHQYIVVGSSNNNLITPPPWSKTSDGLKAIFYQLALERLAEKCGGAAHTINLNLSADLVRKGYEKGDILDFTRRKLVQNLKRGGITTPLVWLALEVATPGNGPLTREGRPHIHGAIMLPPEQEITTVKRLLKINNEFNPVFKNHELRMSNIYDGINQAQYTLKYRSVAHLFLPGAKLLTRTNRVGSFAKELYSEFRDSIKQVKRLVRPPKTGSTGL